MPVNALSLSAGAGCAKWDQTQEEGLSSSTEELDRAIQGVGPSRLQRGVCGCVQPSALASNLAVNKRGGGRGLS